MQTNNFVIGFGMSFWRTDYFMLRMYLAVSSGSANRSLICFLNQINRGTIHKPLVIRLLGGKSRP